jgi:tetratricopeptide (TPR) repeat protein
LKKPQRRGPSPSVPIDTLAARAAEALQQERFKEAVELFKLVVRQEPRPEWQESLAAAYAGRARILAAKGMFKEAAMVLENTLAPDGTLREPLLYLKCLIREGQQQQKAAAYALQHVSSKRSLPAARAIRFCGGLEKSRLAARPAPDSRCCANRVEGFAYVVGCL